jgi:endonuclease YncB( thermonuclease family)
MLRKGHILAMAIIFASIIITFTIASAQEELIPIWIKNSAKFWVEGQTSDKEFLTTIEWLIDNDLIKIDSADDEWKTEAGKLYLDKQRLEGDMKILENDVSRLIKENKQLQNAADDHYDWYITEFEKNQELLEKYNELYDAYLYLYNLNSGSSYYYDEPPDVSPPPPSESTPTPTHDCAGYARCITGSVTQIIDGDTIKVDGQSIRFALTSTPELNESGGQEAKEYLEIICPVGSQAIVDEDDGQTEGSYGRIVGVIYCNGMNLNEEILDADLGWLSTGFCSKSEFEFDAWALRHGC